METAPHMPLRTRPRRGIVPVQRRGRQQLTPNESHPLSGPFAALPISRSRQEDARNQQAQKARGRELGTVSTMLKKLSDTTNQIARNLKLQGLLTGLRPKSDEALTWENS